jgi:serine/threonine-protein kinase
VSPNNVFLTYEGQVKLVDFGIAKAVRSAHVTRAGALLGTVRYMAPERASGAPVDRRADVFAAGAILFEMAAGRRLWSDLDDVAVLRRLTAGRIPSLRDVRPDAPEPLARICARALAFEPAGRYATAHEMRAELEALLAQARPPPLPSELGTVVAATFAREREALRLSIEERLSGAGGGTVRAVGAAAPLGAPAAEAGAAAGETAMARWRRQPAPLAAGLAIGTGLAVVTANAPRPGGAPAVVERASPLAAVGSDPGATPAPPSASASSTTAESVELRAYALPPARVFLDDRPLGHGPPHVAVPRGGEHRLRPEAPGRPVLIHDLSLERDALVELTLPPAGALSAEPIGPAAARLVAPARATRPAPARAKAPPPEPPARAKAPLPEAGAASKPPPPLETKSPYKSPS